MQSSANRSQNFFFRSFGLTSLKFFRKLNKINKEPPTYRYDPYDHGRLYALEISDNENLQTLFDWNEKQQIEIIGGAILINDNPKLCVTEIYNLQKIANYNRTNDYISYDTNGYEMVCQVANGVFR